jgi:hypothetical protein
LGHGGDRNSNPETAIPSSAGAAGLSVDRR